MMRLVGEPLAPALTQANGVEDCVYPSTPVAVLFTATPTVEPSWWPKQVSGSQVSSMVECLG